MKERQRWQPEEDGLLRAYVKQYGAKEWSLISQRMGKTLDRDPKSCLERWKNYLKPGIKKGSLTPEEQTLVISLQAKYGNKWKKIASEVPGRTAKRLGKWWEVFKEKQLKQLHKTHRQSDYPDHPLPSISAVPHRSSPEKSVQGKYDHILDTFAEKYVQPNLFPFHTPFPSPTFLPWVNSTAMGSTTPSLSSPSSTPSPSVSLSLSPSDPGVLDSAFPDAAVPPRLLPINHHLGPLVQYCKELEEGRQSWFQHKKEANWRLTRLEQQLASEKTRKIRAKMEEIEAKVKSLREEEAIFLSKTENEYRDQQMALRRDSESKEDKLMETWLFTHAKLTALVKQPMTPTRSPELPPPALHSGTKPVVGDPEKPVYDQSNPHL